nr:UDP-N-acetylglucosamine--undecaprenyl-phosphate N-acetylglucosaminephosphotransferase [Aliikangiella sp. G2MR2-5]
MIFDLFPLILTTFCCALVMVKAVQPIAVEIGLVDRPCVRKKHDGHVPLIGGISTFVAVLVATSIWLPDTQELRMYLIASAMLVFIGILDDKYDLSVRVRLVGQTLVACLMLFGVGTYISNFGNLLGFGTLEIGPLGLIFTFFAILVLINAFNMIDGLDGLLGGQSLNTLISIAILFIIGNNYQDLNYPLILVFALLPYLAFNLDIYKRFTRKIYMGDAGSMFIGLSVIWLLGKGTQGANPSFNPVTALWITAVPLMDMLAIVIRRVRKGHPPFKADRDHLHHICIKAGLSQKKTLALITTMSLLMSAFGILGHLLEFPEVLMLVLFLMIFVIYSRILSYISSKQIA